MPANQSNTSAFTQQRSTGTLVGVGDPRPHPGLPQAQIRANMAESLPVLHLLIVDDDDAVRGACAEIAGRMSFAVVTAPDVPSARAILKHQKVDLLLLDLKAPGAAGGLALLEEVKSAYPDTGVIVMTAFATVSSAVEAMRVGAGDYLTKPFALDELTTVLERSVRAPPVRRSKVRALSASSLRSAAGHGQPHRPHPGDGEALSHPLQGRASRRHPVLILGESGTGKELVGRAPSTSTAPTRTKPFIPIDCGSLVAGV